MSPKVIEVWVLIPVLQEKLPSICYMPNICYVPQTVWFSFFLLHVSKTTTEHSASLFTSKHEVGVSPRGKIIATGGVRTT